MSIIQFMNLISVHFWTYLPAPSSSIVDELNDSSKYIVQSIDSELTQIVTDVIADPTLPRTEDHECPK